MDASSDIAGTERHVPGARYRLWDPSGRAVVLWLYRFAATGRYTCYLEGYSIPSRRKNISRIDGDAAFVVQQAHVWLLMNEPVYQGELEWFWPRFFAETPAKQE